MAYTLVCTVPLHNFKRGQAVTDAATVERLEASHSHHFVRVFSADVEPAPAAPALEEPAE